MKNIIKNTIFLFIALPLVLICLVYAAIQILIDKSIIKKIG